jgi:prolycopene isomerase
MQTPQAEYYDAVVIGSGFGGASSAALLARAGLSVLLCERAEHLGGYAHTVEFGPYRFDPAVRVTFGGGPGGLYDAVFSHLGMAGEVEFLAADRMFDIDLPDGRRIKCPTSFEGLVDAYAEAFPGAARGTESFFAMMRTMHEQGHAMPMSLGLHNLDAVAARFPEYFAHRKRTLDDVAREHVPDDTAARCAVQAMWPYQGAIPSRLGFQAISSAVGNGLEGTYYARGGFSSVIEGLAAGLRAHGGEVVVSNGATRILVEDGAAVGVELESGHVVRCRHVISNADARRTLLGLVGPEHLPANYVKKMTRMTLSDSAFVVFVATDLDLKALDLAHEIFLPNQWDHNEDAANIAAGRPAGVWIGAPSILDDSLGPAGEHVLTITSIAPYDLGRPWNSVRAHYAEAMLKIAERAIPGLRKHITFLETATPETLARYTSNSGGAMYGWEQTPNQSGTQRLGHVTPLRGLLLSGAWTLPGSTSLRCFASGVQTAGIVLAQLGAGPPLPEEAALRANLPDHD